MFPRWTETERLILKPLIRENVDIDAFYTRFSVDAPHMEDIFNQIPDDPFRTEKNVAEFLDKAEDDWDADETATYAVVPQLSEDGSGELAGYAHLWMKWDRKKAELGLLLDKPFWGREYAREVYLTLSEIAFDLHGIDVIEIGHPMPNTNSQRSIEKFIEAAGGQFDGVVHNNVWCGDDLCDSRRYSVSKADLHEAIR